MKRDDLKKTLDAIQPDAYMKTRMDANMETGKTAAKPKRQWVRVLLAVVLCAALTAGIVGFDLYGNRAAVPEETEMSGETFFSDGHVPGALIYAYAQDGQESEAVMSGAGISDAQMTVPTKCRICFVRLDGLSDAEKALASQELAEQIGVAAPGDIPDEELKDGAYIGYDFNERVELRDYMQGSFYFALTDAELASLDYIHIYRENEQMQFSYDSPADVYGDDLRLDGTDPAVPRASITGDVTMDGETYRKNKRYTELLPEVQEGAVCDTRFFYEPKMSEEGGSFCDMVAENPDFVISDLTDTLHFEVYFTDGSFTETVVQVTFDADGFMSLTPLVCRYVTAGEQAEEETTEELTEEETTEETTEETITAAPSVTEEATENSTESNQVPPTAAEEEAEISSETVFDEETTA